jgi:DUF1365 family protein
VNFASALYAGKVAHKRYVPRPHKLAYRVFWMLLDLEELPDLSRSLWLFSFNRFNLFSIHERDHGNSGDPSLRAYVEAAMREGGFLPDGGAIRLLTMPRILGYVFNPLSVYFCYGADGALRATLYEVSNTFGQRHSYLIAADSTDGVVSQEVDKKFYVSPFLEMALTYRFRVEPPGESVAVGIQCSDERGLVLTASLAGKRRALTDGTLAGMFFRYPLLTWKVMAAIHWDALRLWLKGVEIQHRPPPPAETMTVVPRQSDHRSDHVFSSFK